MNRPLERCGIDELEARAGMKSNTESELEVLENELMHRTTSRAEKLLTAIRRALRSKQMVARVHTKLAANRLAQAELPGLAEAVAPVAAPKPAVSVPKSVAPLAPNVNAHRFPLAQMLSAHPVPALAKVQAPIAQLQRMPDEQAYKCLKVSPSAGWEQVEQARREIVARAQPDRLQGLSPEKRKALQDEGRLANAAYKSLLQR